MDHLAFMRNPEDNQISIGPHERLEQYRVIYYPGNYFLNLVDYTVNSTRGIVLNLVLLTLSKPSTTERVWAGLTKSGQDLWVTDVCCAGCDMSYQTWMRHVPLEFFRSGVEACERWLFGMKEGDEMVAEI